MPDCIQLLLYLVHYTWTSDTTEQELNWLDIIVPSKHLATKQNTLWTFRALLHLALGKSDPAPYPFHMWEWGYCSRWHHQQDQGGTLPSPVPESWVSSLTWPCSWCQEERGIYPMKIQVGEFQVKRSRELLHDPFLTLPILSCRGGKKHLWRMKTNGVTLRSQASGGWGKWPRLRISGPM